MTESRRARLAVWVRIVAWLTVIGGLLIGAAVFAYAAEAALFARVSAVQSGQRFINTEDRNVYLALYGTGLAIMSGSLVAGFGLRILRIATLSKVTNVEE